MQKFRKVTVTLRDERNGKILRLTAEPFAFSEFLEPRSGVFLDATVQSDGIRIKQSAVVMKDYKLLDEKDAESTARVALADFLENLASVVMSPRLSPALDQSAEWRIFVQSKANHLYHAAQQKSFALDVLEAAERFGQYCGLIRFAYLYFLSTNSDVSGCAENLRSSAKALLERNGQRSFSFSL